MANEKRRPVSRASKVPHETSSLDGAIATLDLLLTELRTVSAEAKADEATIRAIIEDIRCVADAIDTLVQANKK